MHEGKRKTCYTNLEISDHCKPKILPIIIWVLDAVRAQTQDNIVFSVAKIFVDISKYSSKKKILAVKS